MRQARARHTRLPPTISPTYENAEQNALRYPVINHRITNRSKTNRYEYRRLRGTPPKNQQNWVLNFVMHFLPSAQLGKPKTQHKTLYVFNGL